MSNQTATRPGKDQRRNEITQGNRVTAEATGEDFYDMVNEITESMTRYCKNRPRVVAGALFGLGFVLGWKIKPW